MLASAKHLDLEPFQTLMYYILDLDGGGGRQAGSELPKQIESEA